MEWRRQNPLFLLLLLLCFRDSPEVLQLTTATLNGSPYNFNALGGSPAHNCGKVTVRQSIEYLPLPEHFKLFDSFMVQ
jgi:hypothetical protein